MKTATSDIRSDYLSGSPSLRSFYQYSPNNPDFSSIISAKSREDTDRKLLAAVITDQYKGLPEYELVNHHIRLLSRENTFTVTTGHQLALFGGPLFTTYKVLSTLRLADDLRQQFPDKNFVPIFWIHTEDHDFEEINHFFPAFNQKITYPGKFSGAVGEHVLEAEIEGIVPPLFSGEAALAFSSGKTLKDAYRAFIHNLFGKYGVVMLDASDPRLKARFRKVMQEEIRSSVAYKEVSRVSAELVAAGYPEQISPRDINLFYSDSQGRNRIIAANGGFDIVDRDLHFTAEELLELIEEHPEKISPNVSLRPLYQEMILPNLAYFGGWGEIGYWMQLKGVFDHFGINFPLILPRMSATIFRKSEVERWTNLGFRPEDIHKPLHELFRLYMPQIWDESPFQRLAADINHKIAELKTYIETEVSETLSRSVEGQKVKMDEFVSNLEKKIHREKRAVHHRPFSEIETLKQAIQPDGAVQERILCLAAFPGISPEQIVSAAWDACSPLDFSHRYLVLD
ncbi:MAG: bacillithiol biosynthesis cysteine-adding enzyme BshC [Bacteroidia bacterium]|nr:bacillithiol biosynthesis cysteine-adding enzyme BshC [Bacteroidia bacterium]